MFALNQFQTMHGLFVRIRNMENYLDFSPKFPYQLNEPCISKLVYRKKRRLEIGSIL